MNERAKWLVSEEAKDAGLFSGGVKAANEEPLDPKTAQINVQSCYSDDLAKLYALEELMMKRERLLALNSTDPYTRRTLEVLERNLSILQEEMFT